MPTVPNACEVGLPAVVHPSHNLHIDTARSILCVPLTQQRPGVEPRIQRRTTAALAVFFRPHAFARLLLWVGLGGDGFGRAGFLWSGVPTPSCARPPRLEPGSGL